MDSVAAKVAKEIGMLLQHHDIDAGACQQKAEHHPGRPAAGDAALRGDRRTRHHHSHCRYCGLAIRETRETLKPAVAAAAIRRVSFAGWWKTSCTGTPAAS